MKLWKENKVDKEWELSNKEIAEKFILSKYSDYQYIGNALVDFISSSDGLNSIWEWDKTKGSIQGSKDMLEIIDIISERLQQ